MQFAFISSCTNAVILRYPCNMSDCSSVPPNGKRRANMTIAEVLKKAREGGYHSNGSDGIDTDDAGANHECSTWTRRENNATYVAGMQAPWLDPQFWRH